MLKPNKFKVIREYGNKYELEELVRRIIRCHLDEFCMESTDLTFPECMVDNFDERLTG